MCVCVTGVCRGRGWLCLSVCVVCQSGFGWITLTHSLSPNGFLLMQREGKPGHWLVPPDWCWGRHPIPHQLAVEVLPGWFWSTTGLSREGALIHDTNVGDAVFQAAGSPSPSLPSAPVPFASKHNFSWRSGKCNHLWKWGLGIISVLHRKWWGNKWITKDLKF